MKPKLGGALPLFRSLPPRADCAGRAGARTWAGQERREAWQGAMMQNPELDGHGVTSGVTRRRFIAGSAAVGMAATGIEGILAARRAPAFAQGTRLNILRWVDFIPACDIELKRQAVDASKALGAEVVFEFINANDLQPRITAAIQSGAGPDVIMMLHNWPHLYANGLVDATDLGEW